VPKKRKRILAIQEVDGCGHPPALDELVRLMPLTAGFMIPTVGKFLFYFILTFKLMENYLAIQHTVPGEAGPRIFQNTERYHFWYVFRIRGSKYCHGAARVNLDPVTRQVCSPGQFTIAIASG